MENFKVFIYLMVLLFPVHAKVSPQEKAVSDTLKISGKSIIFFTLTQTEYDSLSKIEDSEIDAVLSDFYHYSNGIKKFLKKHGIKSIFAVHEVIQTKIDTNKTIYLHKGEDFSSVVSTVMSDGEKYPKIIKGVATDVDLMPEIKKYFQFK